MLDNYLAEEVLEKRFRNLGIVSLILIFMLILVGGIVRSTGAGMGCPEWPKCFGSWVPPTDVSELPIDYQTRFNFHGHGVPTFNVYKTWTEYLNRLLGALVGMVIFAQFLLSFTFYHRDKKIFLLTLTTLLLTGFNGWLGSVVVASNLAPFKVTLHMLLALLVVYTLTYSVRWRFTPAFSYYNKRKFKPLFIGMGLVFLLTLIQIVWGTQVRENVDRVALAMGEAQRGNWIDNLGDVFKIHRSFSIILVSLSGFIFYQIYKAYKNGEAALSFYRLCFVSNCILLLEIVWGIVLAYFELPQWTQPLHLVTGVILSNFQFLMVLSLYKQQNSVKVNLNSVQMAYSSNS